MAKNDFSIDEALRFGWEKMKKYIWVYLGILAIIFAISYIFGGVEALLANIHIANLHQVLVVLLNVLSFVASTIISIGLFKFTLKIVDGKKMSFTDIYSHYKYFWNYLGGEILYGLLVLAGFVLLIFPGVYWAIKYRFVPFLIVDQDMSIGESFKKSAEMTKGNKWTMFGFSFVLKIVILLGFLALLFGVFVAIPIVLISSGFVYRKLINTNK